MRITGLFFSCFMILFLVSCSQGTGKENTETGSEKSEINSRENDSSMVAVSQAEEFDQFIQQFSSEESFQLKRIQFPIRVIIPNTEHEGMAPMEETITKYDWEMLDLTYDSTYLTRPYDQYYQVVRYKNDTAVVEIRGINNGIYANYYFAMINKKWYLVTLYEASF